MHLSSTSVINDFIAWDLVYFSVADNQEMVDCLRTIDATRLVNRAGLVTSDPDVPGWSVVVDGELLPEAGHMNCINHFRQLTQHKGNCNIYHALVRTFVL